MLPSFTYLYPFPANLAEQSRAIPSYNVFDLKNVSDMITDYVYPDTLSEYIQRKLSCTRAVKGEIKWITVMG